MKDIYIMGSINMDIVVETDKFPEEGETVIGKNFITNSGGKGANQAVAIAKQGLTPVFFGAVGNDIFGKQSLSNLQSYGVNINNVLRFDNASTGIAAIIIHKGNNRIILDLGANLVLKLSDYKKVLEKANEGDIFVTQFETSPFNIIDAVKFAKEKKLTIVVNPAPANSFVAKEIMPCIDYLILNETELENLTGIYANSVEQAIEASKIILRQGVGCVILTIGKEGCIVMTGEENVHIPARKVEAVDSTAAGDTFVGIFCVGLINGLNIIESSKMATIASSITVTRRGAQQSIPTNEEIDRIITIKENYEDNT